MASQRKTSQLFNNIINNNMSFVISLQTGIFMQLHKSFLECKHSPVVTASVIEMRGEKRKNENDQSLIQIHQKKQTKKKREREPPRTSVIVKSKALLQEATRRNS